MGGGGTGRGGRRTGGKEISNSKDIRQKKESADKSRENDRLLKSRSTVGMKFFYLLFCVLMLFTFDIHCCARMQKYTGRSLLKH